MKRKNIMILVLLLAIGFASISTTLIINGTLNLGFNSSDFESDVIFTYANTAEGTAEIGETKKTITFETEKIENVGQESTLTYDVTNKSRQYDADATINCGLKSDFESYSEYISINQDLPTNFTLEAGETKRGNVTVKLEKGYDKGLDDTVEFECTIVATPVEREEQGIEYIPDNVYKEELLHGTDPVLTPSVMTLDNEISKPLIPVTIANDGTVTGADITKKWYSYENKEWANAVILKDTYDELNTQGKVNGATKENGYVSLDGEDDYINLGLANYEFTNGITLAIKMRLLKEQNQSSNLIDNLEAAGSSIFVRSDRELRAEFHIDGAYAKMMSIHLEIGKEYTLVATYNNETANLYINGEKVQSLEKIGVITTSAMPFFIGANPGKTNHNEFSNIDVYQSAIYDHALTEEEIKDNCRDDIKITNTDGLLSYVNFTGRRSAGENIPEEDIESYFVWVPKYRYKLFDLGNYDSAIEGEPTESNAKEIEIVFDAKDTENVDGYSCVTPMESGTTGECNVGEWMTHPAFISMGTTGLWVGKFETGYKGATTQAEAEVDTNDSSKVIVKPNVYSWRYISVSNMFKTAYNYNRELDSHMMKNTEWGSVAYLSQSKYGIDGEINTNNTSENLTGYSSVELDSNKSQKYNTETGYKASTTGNITGIYDMSGGAHEFMASYIDGYGDVLSGFTSNELTEYSKYFDKYNSTSTEKSWNNRILGDATGEMGPFYKYSGRYHSNWYTDYLYFAKVSTPWLARGARSEDGINADILYSYSFKGDAHYITSRLLLAPQ